MGYRRMHSTSKGWDNQLVESRYQSQVELEDEASIMDEVEICAQAFVGNSYQTR
ncbi:Hypothetical predicted protein [Olea europaea subsp. europaea]|uniref:Uncharacterized protein n=1 Tax=Olea europaea subsp. europaea TaxID=158383 RepID=A0A8S0TXZ7_OLEEU|nr:Hypothetical predicted protein [Olea europaea subsp. europaea]